MAFFEDLTALRVLWLCQIATAHSWFKLEQLAG